MMNEEKKLITGSYVAFERDLLSDNDPKSTLFLKANSIYMSY